MSILILGGDKITTLKELLLTLGVTNFRHWPMRKTGEMKRELPYNLDGIVMLTDYLNHNAMKRYKRLAKEQGVPLICTKHCSSHVGYEFCKILGKKDEVCPYLS